MIARNAQTIIAIAAILTLLVMALVPAVGGLYWLIQLNSKVDHLQAELADTQREIQDTQQEMQDIRREMQDARREMQDIRREVLTAIEQSEQRILDALANHTHDEHGNAIFTRPVSVEAAPGQYQRDYVGIAGPALTVERCPTDLTDRPGY